MLPSRDDGDSVNDLGAKLGLIGVITPRSARNRAIPEVVANDYGENARIPQFMLDDEGEPVTTNAELDAKLARVSAETDTKIVRLEGKLDAMIQKMDYVLKDAAETRDTVRAEARSGRETSWVVGLGLLAVIIAVLALFPAMFDMGSKNQEKLDSAVRAYLDHAREIAAPVQKTRTP
jgi:hypothetical protein